MVISKIICIFEYYITKQRVVTYTYKMANLDKKIEELLQTYSLTELVELNSEFRKLILDANKADIMKWFGISLSDATKVQNHAALCIAYMEIHKAEYKSK